MLKKLRVIVIALCICACALAFAACDMGGGSQKDDRLYVTYHTNGGYIGGDENETSDYVREIEPDEIADYKPATARKDTWLFGGWFTDELCNNEFDPSMLEELAGEDKKLDLYAKWVDTVTVTKKNFTEFFTVSSRWNGGLGTNNAAITAEFKPKMVLDPAFSAESVEISVTPVLTKNNQTVWSGKTSSIYLKNSEDYFYDGTLRVDNSAAGIEFNPVGKTLDWELVTPSFEIKLLHRVPLTVTLEIGDGATCDESELSLKGGDVIQKDDLPVPVKSKHRFMGWFSDAQFLNEYKGGVITANKTLYAKFVREITVTFYSNGGNETEPRKFLKGESISSYGDPVREGYKFRGWYTTPSFDEGTKFEFGTIANEEDINLYARWDKISTLTFDTVGGSAIELIKIADNETPNIFQTTQKSGLEFGGWYTDAEYKNKYEARPMNGDLTLYVRWLKRVHIEAEQFDKYIDVIFTHEKKESVIELKLTVSLKEEYRKYTVFVAAHWQVDYQKTDGSVGNELFKKATRIDTENDIFDTTEILESSRSFDATSWELNIINSAAYMLVPENELQAK